MNHAGFGRITPENNIQIHAELTGPLGIGDQSIVYALYYPKPNNEKGYEYATVPYDFMITPVPPRLWPRSARLILQLKQKNGSTKIITDYLKSQHVSILKNESSRSAHRYATWNLHVTFEDLPDNLDFDQQKQHFTSTYNKLLRIIEGLREECTEALFWENQEVDNPVQGWINNQLAYFHYYYTQKENHLNLNKHEKWWYKPFELNLGKNGILSSYDNHFKTIIMDIKNKEGHDLTSTAIFCELDTIGLNLRLAVIPQHLINRFFLIGMQYERIGMPDSCVGVIDSILDSFPKEYNIWHLTSFSRRSTETDEDGGILFLIEDQSSSGKIRKKDYFIELAKTRIKGIDETLTDNIKMKEKRPPKIMALKDFITQFPQRKRSLQVDQFKYDIFLSYSCADDYFANEIYEAFARHGIVCYKSGKYLQGGDFYTEDIREALTQSREFCVLCSRNSLDSMWVQTEWGASWGLGLKILPVLLEVNTRDLPLRLQNRHCTRFEKLPNLIAEVKSRKDDAQFGNLGNLFYA